MVAGLALTLPLSAQKTVKESRRLSAAPVIDGATADWGEDWNNDTKSKFLYDIANDADNLYVRVKATTNALQQKILMLGFTVYLNPDGGNKKGKLGLHYPLAKDLEEVKKEQGGSADAPKSWVDMKKAMLTDDDMLELLGLGKDPIITPKLGLNNGVQVVVTIDDFGDLIYEAKLPFKAFQIDKSKVEDLGIVLETGKVTVKQPLSSNNAVYYHGVRYSAPISAPAYNEYTSSTSLHLNYKLN